MYTYFSSSSLFILIIIHGMLVSMYMCVYVDASRSGDALITQIPSGVALSLQVRELLLDKTFYTLAAADYKAGSLRHTKIALIFIL